MTLNTTALRFLHRSHRLASPRLQTLFEQVLESKQRPDSLQQTDVEPSLESILPKCRVLVAKLLECDSCSFYTDNKSQLETHIQEHQAPNTSDGTIKTKRHRKRRMGVARSLLCAECKLRLSNPEMFAWHTEFCHGADAIVKVVKVSKFQFNFECVFCGTVCKYLHLIIYHLRSQHQVKNLPFHCDACDMKFIERNRLRKHLLVCKGKKTVSENSAQCNQMKNARINCKMCSEKFDTKEFLDQHISHFHATKIRERYACLHCEELFEFVQRLRSHCDSRHPGKHVAQCDICNTKFSSFEGFNRHKKYKHLKPTLTCNMCTATFSYPKSIKQHMKDVHTQETWPCNICTSTFRCEQYLLIHVRGVHSNLILYCQHCSYSTRRKHDLVKHVLHKHSIIDRTHSCQFCDASFKHRNYLLRHIRYVHTGPVLHCNHCKYSTMRKYDLVKHLRREHSHLKNTFFCKYCSAKFKCELYLRNHVNYVHTGPINYCEHCNYATRNKYHLVRHHTSRHMRSSSAKSRK